MSSHFIPADMSKTASRGDSDPGDAMLLRITPLGSEASLAPAAFSSPTPVRAPSARTSTSPTDVALAPKTSQVPARLRSVIRAARPLTDLHQWGCEAVELQVSSAPATDAARVAESTSDTATPGSCRREGDARGGSGPQHVGPAAVVDALDLTLGYRAEHPTTPTPAVAQASQPASARAHVVSAVHPPSRPEPAKLAPPISTSTSGTTPTSTVGSRIPPNSAPHTTGAPRTTTHLSSNATKENTK